MIQQPWISENRKILVCVDSYDGDVLKGRFYHPYRDMTFSSLSQLLIGIEELLEQQQMPQSYTSLRTFSNLLQPSGSSDTPSQIRRGKRATFELQILFRQHTSWQGVAVWRERSAEHSFRSVLELVLLMDSALRDIEGGGSV